MRVRGSLTKARRVAAPRCQGTCPAPSWGPAACSKLGCSSGWRMGTLGAGSEVANRASAEKRRAGRLGRRATFWGTTESSQGLRSEGSCIVGRTQPEDGRGSDWREGCPESRWQRPKLRAGMERCVGSKDDRKTARVGGKETEVVGGAGRAESLEILCP